MQLQVTCGKSSNDGDQRRRGEGLLRKGETRQGGQAGMWPMQRHTVNRVGWEGSVTAL